MDTVLQFIVDYGPTVVAAVTALVTVASAAARLTPTQSDDKVVDAVLRILNFLALNKPAPKSK